MLGSCSSLLLLIPSLRHTRLWSSLFCCHSRQFFFQQSQHGSFHLQLQDCVGKHFCHQWQFELPDPLLSVFYFPIISYPSRWALAPVLRGKKASGIQQAVECTINPQCAATIFLSAAGKSKRRWKPLQERACLLNILSRSALLISSMWCSHAFHVWQTTTRWRF